jgi:hypothetical protein
MRKTIVLLSLAVLLTFSLSLWSQEKFIDVRQAMADHLASVKKFWGERDRAKANEEFEKAQEVWQKDVKPMIIEGEKTSEQFREYYERIAEVEAGLDKLGGLLESGTAQEIDPVANAIIWAISHHPRGFNVPKPRYSVWDWVFGLGIGIGFCLFAIFFGRHLRRSYYRRYEKGGE